MTSRPIPRVFGIVQLKQDGSNTIQVTTERDFHPTWSPDGNDFIVVHEGAEQQTLVRVSANGLERQPIFTCPQTCTSPAWAPDGQHILFSMPPSASTEAADIFQITKEGTGLQQLTTTPTDERAPSWSPDGQLIAFETVSVDRATTSIQVMDRQGANIRTLPPVATHNQHPSWSPDGTRLVFATLQELYTIKIDGSELTQLNTGTSSPVLVAEPVWSPDGNYIAYASFSTGFTNIAIVSTDGQEYHLFQEGVNPAWIP